MRQKILKITGYSLFGLLVLLACLHLTLPAESCAQRLSYELYKQTAGEWRLSYSQARAYRLTGLALQHVRLERFKGGEVVMSITLDTLRARLRLFPLLLGRYSASLMFLLGEGRLDARISRMGPNNIEFRTQFAGFHVKDLPMLNKLLHDVPVTGLLQGEASGAWQGALHNSQADVSFQWEKSAIGPTNIAGVALPLIELGDVNSSIQLQDSKIKLLSFEQRGGFVSLQAGGSVQLREPLANSGLSLCLQLRGEANFMNNQPKLQAAMQLAEVRLKKDPQGYLHVPLTGSLQEPNISPQICKLSVR